MPPSKSKALSPLERSAAIIAQCTPLAQNYLKTIEQRQVSPSKTAIEALSGFDAPMPLRPPAPGATLAKLDALGSPATMASAAGRYFGLVVGGTLPEALGARILAASWDQVVFSEATSPIGVKLEQVSAKWLLDIFGLPETCSVGFTTGATVANFTCLAGARNALLMRQDWDVQKQGLCGAPPIRVVASKQIHVTVLKALSLLGLGTDCVEFAACDMQGRVIVDSLPELDSRTLVLLQAGNVNSGASDPIGEIAALAKKCGAWVHVDGAFGLWAAASPKTRSQLAGYEAADSWVVDGHKWLNTPYDCGIFICRHSRDIHASMATQAPYLKDGAIAAPKDMAPEFSRSARGVEVWAALHSLGRSGLTALIDRCCGHAQYFAKELEMMGFEILNDVVLNQVVATLKDEEHLCAEIAAYVQASGEAWFGATHWQDRPALRISITSWATRKEDVDKALAAIEAALQKARTNSER